MAQSKIYNTMSPFEFKNILLQVAGDSALTKKHPILNAGRGNPNFLNTTVRDAFSYLQHFMSDLSNQYSEYHHVGLRPEINGIAEKLQSFLKEKHEGHGADFLHDSIAFAEAKFHFVPDQFIFELGDAALGDFYPSPPRIFPRFEKIFNAYLQRILGREAAEQQFDLFATEGATMAMIYIFNTLKENHLLNAHDHIALITPIFSPYLEIPPLKDYQLHQIHVEAKENIQWQIPDSEFEKLKDPNVKALFLVNPSNPPGVSLSTETREKLIKLVKEHRQDLIIITDDVYATFVNDFCSGAYALPENTIGVYSFSKYFGVTGWRLGLIMISENNIFDRMIHDLTPHQQQELNRRYRLDSTDPSHIKFVDRLAIDSRQVALAHTGGLSGPQQAFMSLLALFELMDENYSYKKSIHSILKKRIDALYKSLEWILLSGPHYTHYYILLNLNELAEHRHGEKFAKAFAKKISVYDFLLKLAEDTGTVCLPGAGFAGPAHTIRLSIANLDDKDYPIIGKNILRVIDAYQEKL